MADVLVVNPLGAALGHYQRALVHNLESAGVATTVLSYEEPSVSRRNRLLWALDLHRALLASRRSRPAAVLVLWPPLGYLDLVLSRLLGGRRCWVVLHDPIPLVRSVGYGRTATSCARVLPIARLITHSRRADDDLRRLTGRPSRIVTHPVAAPTTRRPSGLPTTVRVLGQFKADRDVDLMEALGKQLSPDIRLEVVGRGWPVVDGWSSTDRFVDDDEFDRLVRTSDAVVIPYRRFFQSGVAVRCVEVGTPVVGPADSSLRDLLTDDAVGLVRDTSILDDWVRAVDAALGVGTAAAERTAQAAHAAAVGDWSAWASIDHAPSAR